MFFFFLGYPVSSNFPLVFVGLLQEFILVIVRYSSFFRNFDFEHFRRFCCILSLIILGIPPGCFTMFSPRLSAGNPSGDTSRNPQGIAYGSHSGVLNESLPDVPDRNLPGVISGDSPEVTFRNRQEVLCRNVSEVFQKLLLKIQQKFFKKITKLSLWKICMIIEIPLGDFHWNPLEVAREIPRSIR